MKHQWSDQGLPGNATAMESKKTMPSAFPKLDHDIFYGNNHQFSGWSILKPILKTILKLVAEWFSGGVGIPGEAVIRFREVEREISRFSKPKTRNRKIDACPLDTDFPLHRIPGEEKDAGKHYIDLENLKSLRIKNPWLEAVSKNKNNKVTPQEVIRGLDDIYTRPVQGLFESAAASHPHKEQPPKIEPSPAQERLPVPSLMARGLSLLNASGLGYLGLATTRKTIAALLDAELDAGFPEPKAEAEDQQPPEVIQTKANPIEACLSYGYESDECEPTTEVLPQIVPISVQIGQPPTVLPTTVVPKRYSAPPHASALPLLTKARSAELDLPQQKSIYLTYEAKIDETSSVQQMVQNNIILHNSISNLADAYFRKAEQEALELNSPI